MRQDTDGDANTKGRVMTPQSLATAVDALHLVPDHVYDAIGVAKAWGFDQAAWMFETLKKLRAAGRSQDSRLSELQRAQFYLGLEIEREGGLVKAANKIEAVEQGWRESYEQLREQMMQLEKDRAASMAKMHADNGRLARALKRAESKLKSRVVSHNLKVVRGRR